MSMKTLTRLVGIMLLSAGMAASAATEILSNGDFEDGVLPPWQSNDGKWSVNGTRAHSGNYSVSASSLDGGGGSELTQAFAPVAVEDIASMSYWYYAVSDDPAGLALELFFTDGSSVQDFIPRMQADQWVMRDVMGTLSLQTGKSLEKITFFDSFGSELFIDDASIQIIPEPASLVLFGLAGLLLRKRK